MQRVDRSALLEFAQLPARGADDAIRDAGQRRDLDAVALIGRAFLDSVQKNDPVPVLDGVEMDIGQFGVFVREPGQLEIVRREQRQAAVLLDQVAQDGEGQRHAVEGRGAAADFVHQHQAVRRRVVQDRRRLGHLDHEGGTAGSEIVGSADTGEHAVERAEDATVGRHVTADVGEQGDQRDLAHVGRFAAHVGAGDQQQAAVLGEPAVVGDEGFGAVGHLALDHRVTAAGHGQPGFRGKFRLAPVALQGRVGKAGQQVELGDGAGDGLQGRHGRQQFVEDRLVEQLFAGQRAFLRRQRLVLESL